MEEIIKKHQDKIIDENTQQMLNKPLTDVTGFNEGHEDFLKTLISKLESGELDPHNTDTLYNHPVYDSLSEEEQEATSLTAVNLMSMIRQIEQLWKMDQNPTFQIQNLVENVFQMKSKFEAKHGDVFII
jgi:ABC-type oligopeptide transport system substrate-binding subunit